MSTTYGSGGIPIVQGVDVTPSNPPNHQTPYGVPSARPSSNTTYDKQQQQQGTDALDDPFIPTTETPFNGVKGEQQPKQYKDVVWAIAFVAHLVVMVILLTIGAAGRNYNGDNNNYSGVAWCVAWCGLVAIGLSTISFGFMMQFATELVKVALIFSVVCSLCVGIVGAMSGQLMMAIMGFASFAIGCCYAYIVWKRIPFAASNLKTALTAVRANLGLAAVAYLFMAIALGWSLFWAVGLGDLLNTVGNGILFLFLLSYYWTHQVLQNIVHVTNAGVIGTWWFVPDEASTCWSSGLQDSFVRATTYSFGSICFGSFLVALVQALRALQRIARDNDDMNFLVCLIDCILACIQGIIEYLNKWAYVYVGLYGYSYLEAGRNVITLFQNKGWTAIITDDLCDNVLFMVSVGIGLATGLVGFILGKINGNLFAGIGYEDAGVVGFIVGLLVGFLLSSILMSVVSSAVNTVIICFAESPAEFEANHPHLSQEMRATWRQAWPVECANI